MTHLIASDCYQDAIFLVVSEKTTYAARATIEATKWWESSEEQTLFFLLKKPAKSMKRYVYLFTKCQQ